MPNAADDWLDNAQTGPAFHGRVRHDRGLAQEVVFWRDKCQNTAKALRQETERRAEAEARLSHILRRHELDQEAQRRRIARELHDTLGQYLTLLQLNIDGVGRVCPDNAEVQQRLTGIKTIAADAGREVGRLAWEIRPPELDDFGIQAAVRNLLDRWSECSDLQFDLHLTPDTARLPAAVETTLYRVLQEALTNVVRHAGATRAGVILGSANGDVTMIVEDDGRGFAGAEPRMTSSRARRHGLRGIRERLSLVGGSLEVESAPGRGTTLFVRIPVA